MTDKGLQYAFSNLHKFYRLYLIIPLTSASERSFSTLRQLDTYLTTMTDESFPLRNSTNRKVPSPESLKNNSLKEGQEATVHKRKLK